MSSDPNTITATSGARAPIQNAVANAARQTNTDFDYLLAQARLESGLRPDAKAKTSSATGLFQFIESTWLATMKQHGSALGFGDVAASIQQSGGNYYVADPAARKEILGLRKDPHVAALMAGALAQQNRAAILPVLGREPQATELYMAHFLGAGDARRFLSELNQNPGQSAAALFPKPAAANRAIFYNSNGTARNLGEVMGLMQGKMSRAIAANDPVPQPAGGHIPITAQRALARAETPAIPNSSATAWPRGRMQMPSNFGGITPPRQSIDPAQRPPMSDLLRQSFSLNDTSNTNGAATQHVRRAYASLKAFGL